MSANRSVLMLGAGLIVLIAACASGEAPAEPATPPLTAVRPLETLPPFTTTLPLVPTTVNLPTDPTLPQVTAAPVDEPKPGVERFIPTLPLQDGRATLDAVFVDGTRAAVSWPADLDLVSEGLIPYGWAFISGGSSRDFFIRPGSVDDVIDRLGGAELLDEYPDGAGGFVGYWRPGDDDVDYLAFQFGNWTVLVFDYRNTLQMSDDHRALWATNFHGEQTAEGFLLLAADLPLELVYAGDYPVPLNITLRGADGEVELTPGPCQAGAIIAAVGETFATWCSENGMMTVSIYGSAEFQQAVKDGLKVGPVQIAVAPPPPDEP